MLIAIVRLKDRGRHSTLIELWLHCAGTAKRSSVMNDDAL